MGFRSGDHAGPSITDGTPAAASYLNSSAQAGGVLCDVVPNQAPSTGYGMALQSGGIALLIQSPFYPEQIPHLTSTKPTPDHHTTAPLLDRWRQALLQHHFSRSASHKCLSVWSKHLKLPFVRCLCSFTHIHPFLLLGLIPTLPLVFYSGQSLFGLFSEEWKEIFSFLESSLLE